MQLSTRCGGISVCDYCEGREPLMNTGREVAYIDSGGLITVISELQVEQIPVEKCPMCGKSFCATPIFTR